MSQELLPGEETEFNTPPRRKHYKCYYYYGRARRTKAGGVVVQHLTEYPKKLKRSETFSEAFDELHRINGGLVKIDQRDLINRYLIPDTVFLKQSSLTGLSEYFYIQKVFEYVWTPQMECDDILGRVSG